MPILPAVRQIAAAAVLLLATAILTPAAESSSSPTSPIHVLLWFDTEDFLLPADDDATLRLCRLLTQRGIRATFKIVGEKARVLEARGRRDVLEALRAHDIGFHSNWHSVHPTPSEYLCESGWLDGVEEFTRREGAGAADVRRILGVPVLSCYGQPGSSWASQALGALPALGVAPRGVPCYVDEGSHVGLDGRPFWFVNALNVYHMAPNYTRMELHAPDAVQPGKEDFTAIANRLSREEGGGLISIFYHPCEWVHREFWDGVNFLRGQNPPRSEWKPPAQRSAEETDAAFARFEGYVDHIRSTPGAHFVTASDLPGLYPDRSRSLGVSPGELDHLAARILASAPRGIDFQVLDRRAFSPADLFELLGESVAGILDRQPTPQRFFPSGILGPTAPPARTLPAGLVRLDAFHRAVVDVRDFVQRTHRVPDRVSLGADAVSPAVFLERLAFLHCYARSLGDVARLESMGIPESVELLTARRVARDTPGVFGGWVIHRADFRAPRILDIARLQAWTLKPALESR